MLFDQKILLTGTHAKYIKFLKEIGLFQTHREAYLQGALIGLIYNNKVPANNEKDENGNTIDASIFSGDLGPVKNNLRYLYRLMMLIDDVDGYEIQDYQNRAFKFDADEKLYSKQIVENMNIFDSYARAGLEIIYKKFKDCKNLEDVRKISYDFLNDFMINDAKVKEEEIVDE